MALPRINTSIGMMLRNGSTDTAVVIKNGIILELKHNGTTFNYNNRNERKSFADLDAWAAYLNVPAQDIQVCWPTRPIATDPLERHIEYSAHSPHWRIVKQIMEAFKIKISSDLLPNYKNHLVNAKIAVLKLEMDPPVYDSAYDTIEYARSYLTDAVRFYEVMVAKNPENRSRYYVPANQKLFIKTEQSTMLPLSVSISDEKIIVDKIGYTSFSEVTGSNELPEIWVLHKRQMSKVRIVTV